METTRHPQPRFEFVATRIVAHREIARDTWQLTFDAAKIAQRALPGQFVMLRIAGRADPLIGRALAMFDRHANADGTLSHVSVVYTVKGKFTTSLSKCVVGDFVEVWGPLGNSFSTDPVDHLILVAGGVGQTPMLTYAKAALGQEQYGDPPQHKDFAQRVTLCYGARTKDHLAGLSDFSRACSHVLIATEDGSLGIRGRVTMALESVLLESLGMRCRIACCGPEPMMHAVAKLADQYQVPCDVSLETPMACGIGICFTCVAKVYQPDGQWDYKRTCMEGPIFDAKSICWE